MKCSACEAEDAKILNELLYKELEKLGVMLRRRGAIELLVTFDGLDDKGRTSIKNLAYEEDKRVKNESTYSVQELQAQLKEERAAHEQTKKENEALNRKEKSENLSNTGQPSSSNAG